MTTITAFIWLLVIIGVIYLALRRIYAFGKNKPPSKKPTSGRAHKSATAVAKKTEHEPPPKEEVQYLQRMYDIDNDRVTFDNDTRTWFAKPGADVQGTYPLVDP